MNWKPCDDTLNLLYSRLVQDSNTAISIMATVATRYKLVFFCPTPALPAVKSAIFATGAGRYPGPGGYTECCFTTPGIGQFRPGQSANPNIGERGKLEEVGETRCETLCADRDIAVEAVKALKSAHPYEEVAYEVYKIEDI